MPGRHGFASASFALVAGESAASKGLWIGNRTRAGAAHHLRRGFAASRGAATSTVRPKRSSSCGRSSPLLRIHRPRRGGIAPACRTETPSALDVVGAEAPRRPAGGRRGGRAAGLTSSTYRIAAVARPASRPGWKVLTPLRQKPASMSSEPGEPVLGRADRQFDQGGRASHRRRHPRRAVRPGQSASG